MMFTTETNPRTKFNKWLKQNPPVPFELDEPKRPAAFQTRNRLKAITGNTESEVAEVYVLTLPTRPAA